MRSRIPRQLRQCVDTSCVGENRSSPRHREASARRFAAAAGALPVHRNRMNEAFLRNLVGVVLTIAVLTALGLWYGMTRSPMPKHSFAPEQAAAKAPEALGASVFERKGCAGCHSVDGSSRVGPSLHRDFGSMV